MPRPASPFEDADLRARYLDQIRAGHGRHAAARIVGCSPASFTSYYKRSPEFRLEVDQAEEAAVEPVTAMLRRRAVEEEDVRAAELYLKHVAPPPKSATAPKGEVTHRHELDTSSVEQLLSIWAGRADVPALPTFIDVESQEITDAHTATPIEADDPA
jgi:hypothetical protein